MSKLVRKRQAPLYSFPSHFLSAPIIFFSSTDGCVTVNDVQIWISLTRQLKSVLLMLIQTFYRQRRLGHLTLYRRGTAFPPSSGFEEGCYSLFWQGTSKCLQRQCEQIFLLFSNLWRKDKEGVSFLDSPGPKCTHQLRERERERCTISAVMPE